MDGIVSLFAPNPPAAPRLALSNDPALPKVIAGQPVTYLWRPTIRLGSYTHPVTGQHFTVTPDRMNKWMTNFRKMRDNGHAVFIPVNHSTKTEDNRGFVLDMRVNGEWLEELHQYIGEDAARDAARSKVSLNIRPNLRDAFGNIYDEAIDHSSLVTNPVILGQREPALAASADAATIESQSAEAGETYVLSATQPGATSMFQLTDAQVTAIRAALGADTTPENIVDRVTQKHTALSTCQTSLSAAQNDAAALRLSAGQPLLTGVALTAIRTATERAKNAAVANGALNKAVADKLYAKLVEPKKDSVNSLALSASGIENDDVPLALSVFEALADNKPVALGSITGAQQILDRRIPGEGDAGQNDQQRAEKELETFGADYAKQTGGRKQTASA